MKDQALPFLEAFHSRSYIQKMWKGKTDKDTFEQLDPGIFDLLHNVNQAVGRGTLVIVKHTYEMVKEILSVVTKTYEVYGSPPDLSPSYYHSFFLTVKPIRMWQVVTDLTVEVKEVRQEMKVIVKGMQDLYRPASFSEELQLGCSRCMSGCLQLINALTQGKDQSDFWLDVAIEPPPGLHHREHSRLGGEKIAG